MDAVSDNAAACVDLLQPIAALTGAVYAAIDVFRAVNGVARSRSGRPLDCAVSWRLFDDAMREQPTQSQAYRSADELRESRAPARVRATFVPPLEMITVPQLQDCVASNAPVVRRIKQAAAENHYICAVGTGVWLVAAAALLDGRQAPMQWAYQSGFARAYPGVAISNDTLVVHADSRILLTSAPSLAHECVLELVSMMGREELARACRDKFIFDPARHFVASMLPVDRVSGLTRDSPLYRAVQWLTSNAGSPLTIGDAALHAAVSERTLARLFQQHLGISPHEFLTDVRMKLGQMWLEVTLKSVEEIANDCGYADVSAFRRVFKSKFGLTPMGYRTRYATRAPRARWKLERLERAVGSLPPTTRSKFS